MTPLAGDSSPRRSTTAGDRLIDGKAWEQYVIHRNLQPQTLLHLIVVKDGPIYLIHYNNFGISIIHPNSKSNGNKNKPLAGICSWTQMYSDLQITKNDAIVYVEHSPNVFTLSVFDEWEGKRTPTPKTTTALFSHKKIIYSDELDLVIFEHPKENTFGVGTSAANGITEFDKEMDENLLKKRYMTVPKPVVRKFQLMNFTTTHVKAGDIEVEMELHVYLEEKKKGKPPLNDHVILRGDWNDFCKCAKIKKMTMLRFMVDDEHLKNKHDVQFNVMWNKEG